MKNICVFLFYCEPHTHISTINSKVQQNDIQSINVMILILCTLYSYKYKHRYWLQCVFLGENIVVIKNLF